LGLAELLAPDSHLGDFMSFLFLPLALRLGFRKHGHEIRSAFDGESAISLAREFRPEVIFLDIRLPDMNGDELMQRLKELNGTRQARFVGLSGDRAGDAPGSTVNALSVSCRALKFAPFSLF
jgi:CheY-like chemotaxis protein